MERFVRYIGHALPVAALLAAGALSVLLLASPERVRHWADGFMDGDQGGTAVLSTGVEGGGYHLFGASLQSYMARRGTWRIRLESSSGSIENVQRLRDGEADLALLQGGLDMEAEGLCALAAVGREYVHLIAPADSPIVSFRDTAGRRVGVGPAGSGSEALAAAIYKFFQFAAPPELVTDHDPNLEQAFRKGEIDAAFLVRSLFTPEIEQLLATGWYRLTPIPESASVARILHGVSGEALPPGLYGPDRTLPSPEDPPFQTLAVDTLLIARPDAPESLVRAVLEALYESGRPQYPRNPILSEAQGRQVDFFPLHPAANAFYHRHDPVSSDRFEIASFFLAGLVCLASTAHFFYLRWAKLRHDRRRKAIVPYFSAMLQFGEGIDTARDSNELSRLIHQMMVTQRAAERDWLEGRLDTEDMENLYAVYNIRSRNAFSKEEMLRDRHTGVREPSPAPPVRKEAPRGRPAPLREYRAESTPRDEEWTAWSEENIGESAPKTAGRILTWDDGVELGRPYPRTNADTPEEIPDDGWEAPSHEESQEQHEPFEPPESGSHPISTANAASVSGTEEQDEDNGQMDLF